MEAFFESDEGFQDVSKEEEKNEKEVRQAAPVGEGRKRGGPGNTSRLNQVGERACKASETD